MKKLILYIISLFFIFNACIAQTVPEYERIVDIGYYKVYYDEDLCTTSFVIYKLYKGGGNISRNGMHFKSYDGLNHFNYTNSGFDRGHLVPAEDFASDSIALRSTFYYVNAIPQTPKLNRGSWKTFENKIRNISQSDSLIIMTGGCDYTKSGIPLRCFKVVYSLTDGKCYYSLLFDNDTGVGRAYSHPLVKKKFSYKKVNRLYNRK